MLVDISICYGGLCWLSHDLMNGYQEVLFVRVGFSVSLSNFLRSMVSIVDALLTLNITASVSMYIRTGTTAVDEVFLLIQVTVGSTWKVTTPGRTDII